MPSKAKDQSEMRPEAAVNRTVQEHPGITVEDAAKAAGVARSTAGKALARLAQAGELVRHPGGRNAGKRQPDRFTAIGVELPESLQRQSSVNREKRAATKTARGKWRAASERPQAPEPRAAAAEKPQRLKAGGLEPLVLAFMAEHKPDGPFSAPQLATALGRSSGAIANCLVRLTDSNQTVQVTLKPRRYALAN
ncbi:MAG: hypothetical protein ACYCXW_22255 [Solirubrobacteraceae bacterium]